MRHVQTEEEWQEEMGKKILGQVRQEVYLDMRFLGTALSELDFKPMHALKTLAVDGQFLYFAPEQLIRVFQKNPGFLDRAYLHCVLHCLFSHLWIGGEKDAARWNLACDIEVEYVIDGMGKPCTKRILSFLRKTVYETLEEARREEKTALSAAVIYRLLERFPEETRKKLSAEFYTDDHCFWQRQGGALSVAAQKSYKRWKQIARQTQMERGRQDAGEARADGEALFAAIAAAGKNRRTYRDFLRKFAQPREELHIDADELDLNFYSYGLRVYGNLPLVEYAESREARKIREFVIVVDTSDSTRGEMVESFLRETFLILNEKNAFFGDAKIWIVQCDNEVQRVDIITNIEELEHFLKGYSIEGGGGTDFRPAFAYVEEQRKQGKFRNLCGLLYFTDGKGIYPRKAPPFETAFLFPENSDTAAVPPWALRLELGNFRNAGEIRQQKMEAMGLEPMTSRV